MKIRLKSKEEIEIMICGGNILKEALKYAASLVKPGISTKEIDEKTEKFIIANPGMTPAFKGYNGFPSTLCTSVNDEVVHSEPSAYILKEGDIISIDCGVKYKGFYTDAAITVPVGKTTIEAENLINVTKKSLEIGISKIKPGVNFKEISRSIQDYVEANGFSVVKELVGHGIGKNLHEDPPIPNFYPHYPLPNIKNGMVFCIEPMVNLKSSEVVFHKDASKVTTQDGSLSAHFEHTIAFIENEVIIVA